MQLESITFLFAVLQKDKAPKLHNKATPPHPIEKRYCPPPWALPPPLPALNL